MAIMALKALDQFGEYGQKSRYDDQSMSAFVENELKEVVPQQYDRIFPELDAQTHIPLGLNINPGAMAWAYDSMDKRGRAAFLGANATDIPRADVSKKRVTHPIRTMVISYGWSVEEIEAARFAGTPLDRAKADAATRALAELEHNTLLQGDDARGLPGFLTNPIIPRITVPNGAWLTTATPDEVIQDLNSVGDQIFILSERSHRPNTMLLPIAQFRYITTTPRSTTTDTTIAEFFLKSNGFVREIMSLPELSTASPAGGPTMLAYQKDPGILSGVIPLAMQQMQAQVVGMETVVPAREKIGGTVWFYPFAAAFGDGI